MDYQQPLDSELSKRPEGPTQLEITEPVRRAWGELATWSTALSVVLYAGVFCLLLSLRLAARTYFGVSLSTTVVALVYVTLLLLPARFYWATGSRIRLGLEREESDTLERGFRSLLYAYRFAGILTILGMLFLTLAVIAVILKNT